MKTIRMMTALALLAAAGCSSSDNNCTEAGACLDASFGDASTGGGAPYIPASGLYQATQYTPGSDECMFGLAAATNSTNPADWITVTTDASGGIKVGKPKGSPAMASLGEGQLTGMTNTITRSNHVTVAAPSTCQYDESVTSMVTLDDATQKTIGLSVTDKLSSRTMCDTPAGVGMTCTTTWSWRLTFKQ